MPLLPISHFPQHRQTECLAACAAMVLHYLQVPFRYDHLVKLLRIGQAGASFRNLRYLERLGIRVSIKRGEVDVLRSCIQNGMPPIVFVATSELSYWQEQTSHAVVAIGVDDHKIYLNDPAFANSPQVVTIDEFALAWLGMDEFYATIRHR